MPRPPAPALLTAALLSLCLLSSCGAPRLAYYPAYPPDPLLDSSGQPLIAQVVRDGAPLLDAPRPRAKRLGRLPFRHPQLLYALQPAAQSTSADHALVGPVDAPGTVSGWIARKDLLPNHPDSARFVVVRAAPTVNEGPAQAPLRAGPGAAYPPLGDAADQFVLLVHAEQAGFVLVGQARVPTVPAGSTGPGKTPRLLGWLPREHALEWSTRLAVRFDKTTFRERPRALIVQTAESLGALPNDGAVPLQQVLYAEGEQGTEDVYRAVRFPVIQERGGSDPLLQVALPGGALGWVAERTPAGVNQVVRERLLPRHDMDAASGLLRRVLNRAHDDPRLLDTAVAAALQTARRPNPQSPGGAHSLAEHLSTRWNFPVQEPLLHLGAEQLGERCSGSGDHCRDGLRALQRSLEALQSVAGEYAVKRRDDGFHPVRSNPFTRENRALRYWWQTPAGTQYAWVPESFLP